MTGLGAFSYSLYLIHFPLLGVLDTLFKHISTNPAFSFIFQFLVVLPVVLIASYVFYLIFEKPFTGTRAEAKMPVVSAPNAL